MCQRVGLGCLSCVPKGRFCCLDTVGVHVQGVSFEVRGIGLCPQGVFVAFPALQCVLQALNRYFEDYAYEQLSQSQLSESQSQSSQSISALLEKYLSQVCLS